MSRVDLVPPAMTLKNFCPPSSTALERLQSCIPCTNSAQISCEATQADRILCCNAQQPKGSTTASLCMLLCIGTDVTTSFLDHGTYRALSSLVALLLSQHVPSLVSFSSPLSVSTLHLLLLA